MKKIISTVALTASLLVAAPAFAQSANDFRAMDRARDMNAQRAMLPPSMVSGSFGGGYNTSYPVYGIPCIFGCGSRKPKDGELRTLADGVTVSYDKRARRWVLVSRPAYQPRGVYVDRDMYVAR